MLGMTWSTTLDAALDHINRINTERDNALQELNQFLKTHPELEDDEHLNLARIALL